MTEEWSNEDLVADIQAGRNRKENLSRLWTQVRPFVCTIAARYGARDETEDLIQEGYFGILEALRKYDAGQGATFLTFAEYDIRARMNQYVRGAGIVRLPAWMAEAAQKYKKTVAEFEKTNGRNPSDIEVAFLLRINVDRAGKWMQKLDRIRAAAKEIESLDAPLDKDDDFTLADTIASGKDPAEAVEDDLFQEQLRRDIWAAVDALPAQQAEALARHYRDESTFQDIEAAMALSEGESRQLCAKGLRTLRSDKKTTGMLRPYYVDLYGISSRGSIRKFFSAGMSSTERAALIDMGEYWERTEQC